MRLNASTKAWVLSLVACLSTSFVCADDAAKPTAVELADGKIALVAPAEWVKVQPKSNIVQYEFSAPKLEEKDKAQAARITFTASGGSIEQKPRALVWSIRAG